MKAYLHFGFDNEPRQTISVPAKLAPMWWQSKGLTTTRSGYGAKIPTIHMAQWNGRWRRVYVACYGNAGTAYIGKPRAWLATVDIDA